MTDTIATYAATPEQSLGRKYGQKDHPLRSPYQRDRDRVIHSTAFRRMMYKTQVFLVHEVDFYRTRLTHTLEVAQISRTIARSLHLNEDLTEAVALAHDLGHTPFGHCGEETLNSLMQDYGGFEHNVHGLRTVDELERRYADYPGLNLSFEIREAFVRHNTKWDKPLSDLSSQSAQKLRDEFLVVGAPLLEIQATLIADSIAYNSHDIDDGLCSGILKESDLATVKLWQRAEECDEIKNSKLTPELRHAAAVRWIINFLASNVINNAQEQIKEQNIVTLNDVRAARKPVVTLSGDIAKEMDELQDFLRVNFYHHHRILRMMTKAQKVLHDLFTAFINTPALLPDTVRQNNNIQDSTVLHRIVTDYIAGMTDRYAEVEYKRIFEPFYPA